MLKVVEITLRCDEEFDAALEVEHAMESHMRQIYKKSKMVENYKVIELSTEEMEAAALSNLLTKINNLTEALNRLRIEGRLT